MARRYEVEELKAMAELTHPNGSVSNKEASLYLIRHALNGDPDALGELVNRLTPVIQARVRRSLLRNRSGLESADPRELLKDLVQEVFLSLWRNEGAALRSWDPAKGASLENFVGLIAERKVIAHLRRRSLPVASNPPEDHVLGPELRRAGPEHGTVSKHLLRALIEHLRKDLSPLGFTLFELLFIWEGTVREVSADLGMKPDAVRKWRTRLRAAAHRWLNEIERRGATR